MRQNHTLDLETILHISHDLRRQGKTVGFTHGAFDLFHYGHLDLLRKSAQRCDFLIVGLDSDESIRHYKSEYRPVIPEEQRQDIVASNLYVDALFIKDSQFLDEATTLELYQEIAPDFVSYGRNFAAEELLTSRASRAGTKLFKFDSVAPPQSTTDIINKIISAHEEKLRREKNKPPIVERV